MKKRKAEMCVWEIGWHHMVGDFFYPGCSFSVIKKLTKLCKCGKKVGVKK